MERGKAQWRRGGGGGGGRGGGVEASEVQSRLK